MLLIAVEHECDIRRDSNIYVYMCVFSGKRYISNKFNCELTNMFLLFAIFLTHLSRRLIGELIV